MVNDIYKKLTLPVYTLYYLKKYGGIWGLKKHISCDNKSRSRLLEIYNKYLGRYGSWIGCDSEFSGVPCFPHGYYGVFISGGAKFGKNVVIFHQVTVGSNTLSSSKGQGAPAIGNNVYIGAGAKIIGNINIGDNCRIGANAVIYQDLPPHSVAVASPTRIIQKSNLDNRYYSQIDGNWVFFQDGNWMEDVSRSSILG